ncbi:MAG: hypothetical protein Q9160_000923 [Pyrenula sp. 1 TL-2023]
MPSVDQAIVHKYGFTAQDASANSLFDEDKLSPTPSSVAATPIPQTSTATHILEYTKTHLPRQTFHHSMRVYHFGISIARQVFPAWNMDQGSPLEETYFLACMLHDIGTTDANMNDTLMSFEFYGAQLALSELEKAGAPKVQAESVAEAIIRHQDIGNAGKVTAMTALIQLATVLDNMGFHPRLVHRETIEDVVKAWPREGWCKCFSDVIRKENGRKPWAHTTKLGEDDFPNGVLNNALMRPYD